MDHPHNQYTSGDNITLHDQQTGSWVSGQIGVITDTYFELMVNGVHYGKFDIDNLKVKPLSKS